MVDSKLAHTGDRNAYRIPMAVGLAVFFLLTTAMIHTTITAEEGYWKLTCSVYPYLPDVNFYAGILEEE